MAKIPAGIPKDDDFIHQYGNGGIPQAGNPTLSDHNATEFQTYMQNQESQNASVPKISPHDLMAGSKAATFGPPTTLPLQAPAPENFGPPKIGKVETDQMAQFGAPGSQGFKNTVNSFGPPKAPPTAQPVSNQNFAQKNAQTSQQQTLEATHPQQLGAPQASEKTQSNSTPSQGGGSGQQGGATVQTVEKMEVNNMLQNAMNHMKLTDPDPDAWN